MSRIIIARLVERTLDNALPLMKSEKQLLVAALIEHRVRIYTLSSKVESDLNYAPSLAGALLSMLEGHVETTNRLLRLVEADKVWRGIE